MRVRSGRPDGPGRRRHARRGAVRPTSRLVRNSTAPSRPAVRRVGPRPPRDRGPTIPQGGGVGVRAGVRPPGAASAPVRRRRRSGRARARRPRRRRAVRRSRPRPGVPDSAARAIAPRSRSSGTWMSPCRPTVARKMPERGRDAVATPLGGGRRLLGDLDAQLRPGVQQRHDRGRGADRCAPATARRARSPVSTGCGIQSSATRPPRTSASAHSTCAASARGQECTKTTPRVRTRAPAGTARVPA